MGVETWNIEKNALRWQGGNAIIAHPPCRSWGNYQWRAKPRLGERELAKWAVAKVRFWGGIVEHPVTSKLWDEMNLPYPGKKPDHFGGWSLNIDQKWFGHPAKKNTLLYIVGIKPKEIPPYPITLHKAKTTVEMLSRKQREETPIKFAQWLIETARLINQNLYGGQEPTTWIQKQVN